MIDSIPEINEVRRRTLSYWYVDGLTEIAAGCVLLLTGLLFLVEALVPAGSLPPGSSAVGLPVIIIAGIFAAQRAVRAVKERLTYPRTGYVAYRRRKGLGRVIIGIMAAVLAALAVMLLSFLPESGTSLLPFIEGAIVGAFLLYHGYVLGLARFYMVAMLSILVGLICALAGFGESLGLGIYFASLGLGSAVSGGLTLRAYLAQTQPVTEN